MGSLRTRTIETRPINNNSVVNVADSELHPFNSRSCPSLPGEIKDTVADDKQFGDTFPCEDIFPNNDAFDTQVVDFDEETQPVNFEEETQIMILAGETQVMDDYDFIGHLDTQVLDISNNEEECENDGEGAERAEVLDETGDSVDIQFSDGSGIQTTASRESGTCHHDEDVGGAKSESLPSDNVTRSSGSSKRGFASVRTASLRAAGLAAREMVSKKAIDGSFSTASSSEFCKLDYFNGYGGISDAETVGLENDAQKHNEKGLSNRDKSNVPRSLEREFFMEEDVTKEGSDDNASGRRADFSQLPACGDLAGLSYVDSQEPGELSQASALEFVERFLKVNVLESDQDVMHKNAVVETVNAGAIAKGTQNIAQQANCRSTLAQASIFEWDDKLEDEGGGGFFTKKKEVLFGTTHGDHKSGTKPRSSSPREPRGSQSLQKLRNDKEQNTHDTILGFLHSDLKLVNGGKKSQQKEMDIEKSTYHFLGIDTQMAAEAMEILSTGTGLMTGDGSMADQDQENGRVRDKREATKNEPLKQSSVQKRINFSDSGVVTRSKRTKGITIKSNEESKYFLTPRTRLQYVTGKFNAHGVKPKPKGNRLSMNDNSAANRREPSNTGAAKVDANGTEIILEGKLNNNPSQPFKRRSLQGNAITFAPAIHKDPGHMELNHSNGANDALGDCANESHWLEVVHKRKCRTRSDSASENLNYKEETMNLTTVAGCMKVDGSNHRGRGIHCTSNQHIGNGEKGCTLRAYGGLAIAFNSIAKRTRSKRSSAQLLEHAQDEGANSSAILSPENACQLSSSKQHGCSPSAKRASTSASLERSPGELQKSFNQADITPVNLKTAGSAVSPICIGDEYRTPSCKKNLSLKKEFIRLTASEHRCNSPFKVLRQRRDMNNVRVLFSQHLDEDTIRQQKKILSRLGVSVASSISEATHFVAGMFVRTRNMLEAIANAKPVVTHLWLESCGQANCFIDEKNYILRDTKKEKELGFSMPRSLAHASHHPLLEDRRVLITSNVKPGKEVISSLVKAVHGQAVERLCRSMLNNDKLDNLLVLSCEEDFEACLPLLEKGIAVYSSELLLNGIITQRLEYERYRLFVDHVKKTRSTLWLKKGGDQFRPVTKTR